MFSLLLEYERNGVLEILKIIIEQLNLSDIPLCFLSAVSGRCSQNRNKVWWLRNLLPTLRISPPWLLTPTYCQCETWAAVAEVVGSCHPCGILHCLPNVQRGAGSAMLQT